MSLRAAAALVDAPTSQPVTALGQRLLWTALVLLLVAGCYLLMRRGWRRRAARQGDLPPLPTPPQDGPDSEELVCAEGTYVTTTREGDWLDRVVTSGLGVRSSARMCVSWDGVRYERDGAPEIFVPAAAVRRVRLQSGMAGKFVEAGGLVVLTWDHGGVGLDTGFRPRHGDARDELRAGVDLVLRSRESMTAQQRPEEQR